MNTEKNMTEEVEAKKAYTFTEDGHIKVKVSPRFELDQMMQTKMRQK